MQVNIDYKMKFLKIQNMSILELSIDVRFNILAKLPLLDLLNFCRINSECVKTIKSEKFWLRKLVVDFPDYVQVQPKNINNKKWYQRVYQSGDAYMINDTPEESSTFVASDVSKCFYVDSGVIFYIDIFNILYLFTNNKLPTSLALGHWESLILKFEPNNKKFCSIKLQENVIDFYMDEHFTAFLSTDGILSTTGCCINKSNENSFVQKLNNIKKILSNGEESVCLLLDDQNNLLWLEDDDSIKKIASNVTSAVVDRIDGYPVIYYVKDGGLWEFYSNPIVKPQTLKRPSNIPKDAKCRDIYVYNLLFEQDVKTVSSMSHFLIVLDVENNIYFHHKRNFHPNDNYENDYYKDRESEELKLAGFDQKYLASHKFKQVLSNTGFETILLLDDKNNMYILDELDLNSELKPLYQGITQIFTFYCYCFIKKRLNI